MKSQARPSRVLGAAFLLQAMTSLAGGILLDFFLVTPGNIGKTMANISQHAAWMRIDFLDEMVTAGGVIWLGAVLFATLRRQGEAMARLAFALYILEGAVLAASRIGGVMLLTVSQQYASVGQPPSLLSLGSMAYAAMDRGALLALVPFCAGAFPFYWLLYKSRLVPRWLPVWGLLAMVPFTVGTVGGVLGIAIPFYLFVPYIPFEFAIGIWILFTGVHDGNGASASVRPEAVEVPARTP